MSLFAARDAESGTLRVQSSHVTPHLLRRLAERAEHRASNRSVDITAPLTGEIIGSVPLAEPPDVIHAVERARAAQQIWASTPIEERTALVLRFHDLVLDRREVGMDIVSLETGKIRSAAFEEIIDTAGVARYYAHNAARLLTPQRRRGAFPLLTKAIEYHHPLGVVGCIVPWNYPLVLGITDAIPALLAGNAVVIKPNPQTPYSVLWAAELLHEVGIDPDLVAIVVGEGEDLGPPLIGVVDYLMFTGSTRVGRIVAQQCAARLIGYSLELGGKNAMIVLDDADAETVAQGAIRACFSNAGQLCVHAERIYLPEARWNEFAGTFIQHVQAMRLGAGEDADMGSLISERQLAAVRDHVEDAVAKGALLLAGGRARPDLGTHMFEPTVLSGVTPEMTLFGAETFGPVVALYPYHDESDAIGQANNSPFGLNFSVWTADVERGRRIARRLQAGSVNINEGYGASWASTDAPMGGWKDSGIGRRHGAEGILKYTASQTVAAQHLMPLSRPRWVPEAVWEAGVVGVLRLLKFIYR